MTTTTPTKLVPHEGKSPTSRIMHIVWKLYMMFFGAKFWSAALKGLILTAIRWGLVYTTNQQQTLPAFMVIHSTIGMGYSIGMMILL